MGQPVYKPSAIQTRKEKEKKKSRPWPPPPGFGEVEEDASASIHHRNSLAILFTGSEIMVFWWNRWPSNWNPCSSDRPPIGLKRTLVSRGRSRPLRLRPSSATSPGTRPKRRFFTETTSGCRSPLPAVERTTSLDFVCYLSFWRWLPVQQVSRKA